MFVVYRLSAILDQLANDLFHVINFVLIANDAQDDIDSVKRTDRPSKNTVNDTLRL
ncbi:hypothetical protein VP96_02717 [Vibrio cholerae]|nr:hypothetical protein VP96_02717 [Vibrio cholerae]